MPFHSKQQSKAAFATHGFGGAINPQEWASKTDYSKLPNKVNKRKKRLKSYLHAAQGRAG
jgi:hypothetical protein